MKTETHFPTSRREKEKDDGSGTSSTIGKGDMELVTEAIAKKQKIIFIKLKFLNPAEF
jgi:hypothetical protein